MDVMPKWADVVLVPLISLIIAALLSALLILAIGESPVAALKLMIEGTLLRSSGWGYMLYYTTNFIFTGLAVSVAFHAALFNIGGEGQAMMGGLVWRWSACSSHGRIGALQSLAPHLVQPSLV